MDSPEDELIEYIDPKEARLQNITAVILAGGRGLRMQPYDGPKAMVPIAGQPLVCRLIKHLKDAGIEDVHVCTGYKADEVQDSLEKWDPKLQFSDAGPDATHAERLERVWSQAKTSHMLICYGDTMADVSLDHLCYHARINEAAAVFAACKLKTEFGVVKEEEEGSVTCIEEKPELPYWFNIGFVLAQHWTGLRLNARWSIVDWLNHVAAEDKVCAYRHHGWHYTVNDLRDLSKVNEHFVRRDHA